MLNVSMKYLNLSKILTGIDEFLNAFDWQIAQDHIDQGKSAFQAHTYKSSVHIFHILRWIIRIESSKRLAQKQFAYC